VGKRPRDRRKKLLDEKSEVSGEEAHAELIAETRAKPLLRLKGKEKWATTLEEQLEAQGSRKAGKKRDRRQRESATLKKRSRPPRTRKGNGARVVCEGGEDKRVRTSTIRRCSLTKKARMRSEINRSGPRKRVLNTKKKLSRKSKNITDHFTLAYD